MAAKTDFETRFLIGAKYTGAAEVAKANRGIDSVERNLKGLGGSIAKAHQGFMSFGKAATAAFTGFLALEVTRKIVEIGKKATEAAMGVAKTHEQLGVALESNQKRYAMTGKSLEQQKKRFIELAEAQEKAGGFDAETMEAGWTKLLDTMSPAQIEKFSGFGDMVAKLTQGATKKKVVEISQRFALRSPRAASVCGTQRLKAGDRRFQEVRLTSGAPRAPSRSCSYRGETQRQLERLRARLQRAGRLR